MYPGWGGVHTGYYPRGIARAQPTGISMPDSHIQGPVYPHIQGPVYPHIQGPVYLNLRVRYTSISGSGIPHSQGPIYPLYLILRVPYTQCITKQCQNSVKTVSERSFPEMYTLFARPFDRVLHDSGTRQTLYPHGKVPPDGSLNGQKRPSGLTLVDHRFTISFTEFRVPVYTRP